jgi:hypothetical protein
MLQISKIEIPNPCQENWHEMKPNSGGRFCTHCAKSVVNFENKSPEEILKYFTDPEVKICGRFSTRQLEDLNDYLEEKNRKILPQPLTRNNWLSRMLFLSLSLVPFAFSKTKAQEVVQKTVELDVNNSNPRYINGIAIDEENKEPLKDVTIINLNSNLNTLSNKNGEFKILVNPRDTLLFKGLGIDPEKVTIHDEEFLKKELNPYKLEEIVVSMTMGLFVPKYSGPLSLLLKTSIFEEPLIK